MTITQQIITAEGITTPKTDTGVDIEQYQILSLDEGTLHYQNERSGESFTVRRVPADHEF